MLEEHYGVVMMFNALIKELYSLKQGSGENVAEFSVYLLQQAQILQSEYPGRIQQEHMEEMKWNHFYKGLNPTYWHMLAHKVYGKHPASYSNFLLAVQKLERQTEPRDPLLSKTTKIGGTNVIQPQTSGNLISHSAISFNLPMQSSYIKRKPRIVLGATVLTTWWKIVQRISARSPEKPV